MTCASSTRVLLTAYADTSAAIYANNRSQLDYYLLKPRDPPEERLFPVLDDLIEDWRAGFRPGHVLTGLLASCELLPGTARAARWR